jgi:hypothetical protein
MSGKPPKRKRVAHCKPVTGAEVLRFAKRLMRRIARDVPKGEEPVSVYYLLTPSKTVAYVVGDREEAPDEIHALVHECKAQALVGVLPSWAVDQADLSDMAPRWIGRYQKHPRRKNVVVVIAEHIGMPTTAWIAEVGRRRISEFYDLPQPEGRFIGLLRCGAE